MGELVVVAAGIIGFVTIAGWLLASADLRSRSARNPPLPQATWVCWVDRRFGEMCEPANRLPPVRRHYARDVY
jgi:hypothetical protein